MNKDRRMILFAIFVFALALFLPDILLKASDKKSAQPFPIAKSPSSYEYIGTLEDRVRALSAYENASSSVLRISESGTRPIGECPEEIRALIPDIRFDSGTACSFSLSPTGMNARFAYEELIFSSDSGRLRILKDFETGKALSIQLTQAQTALKEWEHSRTATIDGMENAVTLDAYALAARYAASLGYPSISDLTDGVSYGRSASTVKVDIRGVALSASVTFSAPAGVLTYRLMNSGE